MHARVALHYIGLDTIPHHHQALNIITYHHILHALPFDSMTSALHYIIWYYITINLQTYLHIHIHKYVYCIYDKITMCVCLSM